MEFKDLGYNDSIDQLRKDQGLESFQIARVILEHKERYVIKTPELEYDAELIGNLRFTAESRYDFPAVGDWVSFMEYDNGKALINGILERQSIIERKAVGKTGQIQIIATNIDFGIIVQAVDRDFNINRIERYLTICYSSKVKPIIVLSKIDLISNEELELISQQLNDRIKDVPIIKVSNESIGYNDLISKIEVGKTYCLLGSSGVGKSTLLNALAGDNKMKTANISDAVNKGRHTTSHRELIVLENGGILIDNPGMREVGLTDAQGGIENTFDSILIYAESCRYSDCTHIHEKGCAVIEAVENGDIDEHAYNNYQKMEREKMHFESDSQERKKKDKELGRMIKEVKRHRKNNKY